MQEKNRETVKVAVIGVGHLGQHHARILSELEGVELVCVVDTNGERAKEIAERVGTQALAHWEEIPEEVQAVSVVTPTSSHHELARAMLQSGRDVLVEKPISISLGEADDMTTLAAGNNRVLQVGHIERFNPVILAMAEQLHNPLFIVSHRLGPPTPRVKDVGVVLDLMIHDIDLVCSLVRSPIDDLDAVGVPVLTEQEDIANARLNFKSGCIANLTVSRVTPEAMRKIRIFQKDAYFSLNYMEKQAQIYRKVADPVTGEPDIAIEEKDLREQDALTNELLSFVECVRSRSRPKVGGEEGRLALQLALEITERISNRIQKLDWGL